MRPPDPRQRAFASCRRRELMRASRHSSPQLPPHRLSLVLLKSFVLPTATRSLLGLWSATPKVQDFAFVFGLFPASGANMVYVLAYAPSRRQTSTLLGTLALSKIVTFPLLLLASRLLFADDAHGLALELDLLDEATRLCLLPFCVCTALAALWPRDELLRPDGTLTALVLLESVTLARRFLQDDSHVNAPLSRADLVRASRWGAEISQLALAGGIPTAVWLDEIAAIAKMRSALEQAQAQQSLRPKL